MSEPTLHTIRARLEALASDAGEYSLVCARHGVRPVPADGLAFETRPAARAAAALTEQYRRALRAYDPDLPHHDVVVRQAPVGRPGETDEGIGDPNPEPRPACVGETNEPPDCNGE